MAKSRSEARRISAQVLGGVPSDHLVMWTDGSCGPTNPGWMGTGVWADRPDPDSKKDIRMGQARGPGWGTNNIAELLAVKDAIVLARHVLSWTGPITIVTDSSYVQGVLEKGWHAKENIDLIEELLRLTWEERVTICWVPGHSGIEGNEEADRLAAKGRDMSEQEFGS